jgi:hypothetical protein
MTRIDIAVEIADIPAHWQLPRYKYGQTIVMNYSDLLSLRLEFPTSTADSRF